jgi:hypothetical protein
MISIIIGSLFLAASAAPTAATATTVTAPAPAIEASKEERKICKREAVTTSLYGSKRICLTANQWRQREQRATDEDMGSVSTK